MEELEWLGYLATAPTRSTSPLFPKVFYVTGRGVKNLRKSLAAQGKTWQPARIDRASRHRQEGYSSELVLHEVLVTEFLLAVWQTIQQRPDLDLLCIQRRSLGRHPSFEIRVAGKATRLEPDGMFLFRQMGGGMICSFLELDRGTMNLKQIRMKYRRYEAWAHAEGGKNYLMSLYRQYGAIDPRPSFRVLLVANDRGGDGGYDRMIELFSAALDLPSSLRDRQWFTTVADLQKSQHEPQPLGSAIWRRGRDARSWLATARSAVQASKEGSIAGFVREHLPGVLHHPLFPEPANESRSQVMRSCSAGQELSQASEN